MGLPDFMIIGAAKSATTSIAAYLAQHPQIFMPPTKEPNYFALAGRPLPPAGPASPRVLFDLLYKWSVTDADAYRRLYDATAPGQKAGDASVRYLYCPGTAERIREAVPDVRLVAILREPVARLYSHYMMNRQVGLEPLPLMEALEAEPERRAAGWGWDWHYAGLGLYHRQLSRYARLFDPGQLKVMLYDDFLRAPLETLREICRHVGVDDGFNPDMSRRGMVPYRPRSARLERWLHWPSRPRSALLKTPLRPVALPALAALDRLNRAPVEPLDPALRRALAPRFREDVAALEELIGRRVPWYREP